MGASAPLPGTHGGHVGMLSALMRTSALWSRWQQFKKRGNLGVRQVFNQRAEISQGGGGAGEGSRCRGRGGGGAEAGSLASGWWGAGEGGRVPHSVHILASGGCVFRSLRWVHLVFTLPVVSPSPVRVRATFADSHRGLAALMRRYWVHVHSGGESQGEF